MTIRIHAAVVLWPTDQGGLTAGLPSGTRSLLLRFPGLDRNDKHVLLGSVLHRPGPDAVLEPGRRYDDVEIWFWVDDARLYVAPGEGFEIWYGRVVGSGEVLEVVDDVPGREREADGVREYPR